MPPPPTCSVFCPSACSLGSIPPSPLNAPPPYLQCVLPLRLLLGQHGGNGPEVELAGLEEAHVAQIPGALRGGQKGGVEGRSKKRTLRRFQEP